MSFFPNKALFDVMAEAYSCRHFGSCREAVFNPTLGLVPRGFLGATGSLRQVQTIFVLAEPGHPLKDESYPKLFHQEILRKAIEHTYHCFRDGKTQLHKNVRMVMKLIWPNLSFDEQLQHIWITEGRLCSVIKETRPFGDTLCAPTHLVRQASLMPEAVFIGFGGKARDRIMLCPDLIARQPIYCGALSPPGCNKKEAQEGWGKAAAAVREKFHSEMQN